MNVSIYDELRKIEGCEKQYDLKATTTDCEEIKKMAKGFNVKDKNIFRDEEATSESTKKIYEEIVKESRRLSADGQKHLIMVYCGGHGASLKEKQVFLFNSSNPNKAKVELEFKLRYILGPASLARIFCMFDCCRVPLSNFPGLSGSRGGE